MLKKFIKESQKLYFIGGVFQALSSGFTNSANLREQKNQNKINQANWEKTFAQNQANYQTNRQDTQNYYNQTREDNLNAMSNKAKDLNNAGLNKGLAVGSPGTPSTQASPASAPSQQSMQQSAPQFAGIQGLESLNTITRDVIEMMTAPDKLAISTSNKAQAQYDSLIAKERINNTITDTSLKKANEKKLDQERNSIVHNLSIDKNRGTKSNETITKDYADIKDIASPTIQGASQDAGNTEASKVARGLQMAASSALSGWQKMWKNSKKGGKPSKGAKNSKNNNKKPFGQYAQR